MALEIPRHCKFGTSTSILIVHSLHKLRKADFIWEQIWKMGAVLSPLLSTIRHQFKTLQYPNIRSMNDNL